LSKKNYAYAYTGLQESSNSVKAHLQKLHPSIFAIVNDSKFNQQSLNTLNLALDRIKKYTTKDNDSSKISINPSSSPEEQLAEYQAKVLQDETEDKPLTSEELNYKLAESMLIRYRDDFQWLLKDVYKDIKTLCEQNDSATIGSLLALNSWMSDILSSHNAELGVIAAKNGYKELLQILYSRSKDIQDYSQKLLDVAAEYDQLQCVQYVVEQGVDPIPLLESNKYHDKHHTGLITLCTDYLITHDKHQYGNYYMGIFKYKNAQYDEAIKLFENVKPHKDLTLFSFFYQGCCYQYLLENDKARACFEQVMKSMSASNDLATKAQKHLEEIALREETAKKFEEYQTQMQQMLATIHGNQLLDKILYAVLDPQSKAFMQYVSEQNSAKVTEAYTILKKLLNETKHIKIVQEISPIIQNANTFKDIPLLAQQHKDQFTDNDKANFPVYTQALETIDHMLELIGTISNGMIVE
jgi:hypothetical protein